MSELLGLPLISFHPFHSTCLYIVNSHFYLQLDFWGPLSELTQTFLRISTSTWPMENLKYFQDPPAHPTSPQPLNSDMVYLSKWQWNQLQGSVSFFQIAIPHTFFFNETPPVASVVLRLEYRCLKGTLPRLALFSPIPASKPLTF